MKPLGLSAFLMNETLTEVSCVFLVIGYPTKGILGMLILLQQVWSVVVNNNYFYGEHFLCCNLGPSFSWLLAGCGEPPPFPFS